MIPQEAELQIKLVAHKNTLPQAVEFLHCFGSHVQPLLALVNHPPTPLPKDSPPFARPAVVKLLRISWETRQPPQPTLGVP